MKYKKGTQEMLDTAKDDATLLPFDTVFVTQVTKDGPSGMISGINVVRGATSPGVGDYSGSKKCVAFMSHDISDYWYVDASDLLPAKKSNPKKWKNGTQAQLDAAKDDARLIPKKTYFIHEGWVWHKAPCEFNGKESVLMVAYGADRTPSMMCADDLEPINAE